MIKFFKPDDFKSIYRLGEDGLDYVGSANKAQREILAATANEALSRIVGLENRFDKAEWKQIREALVEQGQIFNFYHGLENEK